MYFPKQHYESIVPSKPGIIGFFDSNATSIYRRCIVNDVKTPRGTQLCPAKNDCARRRTILFHNPDALNQCIFKDLSCDTPIYRFLTLILAEALVKSVNVFGAARCGRNCNSSILRGTLLRASYMLLVYLL